ncbi:MAG: DUF169 domain-containing protein [bacterium]|nr:DUF169 domain-containing protein [bacterium]
MQLNYQATQDFLMRELRLMTAPVAIKYFFDEQELAAFRSRASHYVPVKPITFCQAEIGARMEGLAVLVEAKKLGCSNARFVFGWKEFDEAEVKSHIKYCRDMDQANRFVQGKPRLQGESPLLAVAVAPLETVAYLPDIIHFYCDNMQAYHLIGDWMAGQDVHPFRPSLSMNSAACGGNVFSYNSQQANMFLACSGSYNSGKTERGEINVSIPFDHLPGMIARMQKRIEEKGGVAITRLGNPFPGADICKNCPLIHFKKED